MPWNPNALPDQSGRTLAVTGATAGIGYFAAEQLAAAGAHVVLLGRSPVKLATAQQTLAEHVPGAKLSSVVVDLAALDSIPRAAAQIAELPSLHGIFLNAGPDATVGGTSADGLPMQMAAHAIGNVALTTAILPTLTRTAEQDGKNTRLVFASTGFVRRMRASVDDLLVVPRSSLSAYIKAKTALEIYAYELDRRFRRDGIPVDSIVTIPGVGVDAKTPTRAGIRDDSTPYLRNPFTLWAQGKDTATWSATRALTDPAATGGDCYGPAGAFRGSPEMITPVDRTAHPAGDTAARITAELETLTQTRR